MYLQKIKILTGYFSKNKGRGKHKKIRPILPEICGGKKKRADSGRGRMIQTILGSDTIDVLQAIQTGRGMKKQQIGKSQGCHGLYHTDDPRDN